MHEKMACQIALDEDVNLRKPKIRNGLGYVECYEPYILSRHPVNTAVATRGFADTTFTKDQFRYNVYIGFGIRPMGRNPFVRFLIVKGTNLNDPQDKEGVLLIEDPMGSSTSKSGREPLKLLRKRASSDSKYVIAARCYNIALGMLNTFHGMSILDGKDFKPLYKTGEFLSVPVIGQILGSFIEDPYGGFYTTMDGLEMPSFEPNKSVGLYEYFKIESTLAAFPKLWNSFRATGRPDALICRLVAEHTLNVEGDPFPDKGKDNIFSEEEMKFLGNLLGISDHNKWLANLGSAGVLSLARQAWDNISSRIGLEGCTSRIEMSDPGGNPLRVSLQLPNAEVLSDIIIRLCQSLGIG